MIRLTIAIPYLFIWLAAMYSYLQTKRYANLISPSQESTAFAKIAFGILMLLGSLITATLLNSLRSMLAQNADIRPFLTILTNYAYVLPYLVAFIYLFNAAFELVSQQIEFTIPIMKSALYSLPLFILAYIWLEFIFTNQYRVTAPPMSLFASYYLKDSLLILTIILPSLLTWAIGLLAVIKLRMYHEKVKGIIYKKSLSAFVYGFITVILGSILLQSLLSLGPQRLLDLGLGKLLGVIYIFLLAQIIGYFSIARGANNLSKIESV